LDHTDLAARYFAHMKARNLQGLTELFAEDATFALPDGRELAGARAIHDMYAQLFAAGAPSPTPLATISDGQGIATEIEARLPNGTVRRTANFFHLNAQGLIRRLSVYTRAG